MQPPRVRHVPRHAGPLLVAVVSLLSTVIAFAGTPVSAASSRAILPPRDPSTNLSIPSAVDTYTCVTTGGTKSCTGACVSGPTAALNESRACANVALAAIDSGRAREGLPALRVPRNWYALTVPEQLFVLAGLERTARGLPPYVGLSSQLDAAAQAGANTATDPSYPPTGLRGESGNWSVSAPSPLVADLEWMYADGAGGSNVNCTHAGEAQCWGHRNNILGLDTGVTCANCVMGAAYDPSFRSYGPAYAELFVAPAPGTHFSMFFTWAANVAPYL